MMFEDEADCCHGPVCTMRSACPLGQYAVHLFHSSNISSIPSIPYEQLPAKYACAWGCVCVGMCVCVWRCAVCNPYRLVGASLA